LLTRAILWPATDIHPRRGSRGRPRQARQPRQAPAGAAAGARALAQADRADGAHHGLAAGERDDRQFVGDGDTQQA